jgi:hypothetical protein
MPAPIEDANGYARRKIGMPIPIQEAHEPARRNDRDAGTDRRRTGIGWLPVRSFLAASSGIPAHVVFEPGRSNRAAFFCFAVWKNAL